ncbi:MAG: hypothetical protein ABIH23_28255 [bacterium]
MKRMIWLPTTLMLSIGLSQVGAEPKTLLFSPISPEYLEASAPEWAGIGFNGFLLSGIMHNWDSDVWAVDKDPETRGIADETLQRVRKCCQACRAAGIEDNFIKVAFYSHLPDWFDDDGWQELTENFRNAAEFARLAGMRGIAIDIEYIMDTYHVYWKGYKEKQYNAEALCAKALERGYQMIAPMYDEFPDMVLLTLPEGIYYYGPLAVNLTIGFIQAAAKRDAPGGVHILTEGTYAERDPIRLLSHISQVDGQLRDVLPPNLLEYWWKRGSIAIGCWPLGYYRELYDENGKQIGYGGKREKFGDENIGSYGDKSCNYPPDEFAAQYAFTTTFTRSYNWIYAHGATWWQFNEEEAKRFNGRNNDRLPVDERLDDFKEIVRRKPRLSDPVLSGIAREYCATGRMQVADRFGLIKDWLVLGPFENEGDPPNRNSAFRKALIDTERTRFPQTVTTEDGRSMTWQLCHANPQSGYVNMMPVFDPNIWISYVALCYVHSPTKRAAQLRTGSNDGIAVWVNGEKLYEVNRKRGPIIDDDIINIVLPAGTSSILLQVCQMSGTTGFYARITDSHGELFDDVSVGSEQWAVRTGLGVWNGVCVSV